MKNAPDNNEHLTDLRIPYLENMLTSEERSMFEAHLKDCSQCAEEFEAMKSWVGMLQCNKEVFCPEPWEVFDQWRNAKSLDPAIASHTERCPACTQDFTDFNNAQGQAMPARLWAEMTGRPQEVRRTRARQWEHLQEMLAELWAMVFRPPVLALATVAAVALAVVFLYPAAMHRTIIGLGSAKWEPTLLERNLMGTITPMEPKDQPREHVAVVLLFEGFEQPVPQPRVEELYEELRPTPEIRERFALVTPAQITEAVREKRLDTSTPKNLIQGLREVFDVSSAVLVMIRPENNRFDVRSDMTDTHSGKTMATIEIRHVSADKLPSIVNTATTFLLGLRQ